MFDYSIFQHSHNVQLFNIPTFSQYPIILHVIYGNNERAAAERE